MKKESNEWPKMLYHVSSAAYIVCANIDQVPDGYVDFEDIEGDLPEEFEQDLTVQVRIDNDLEVAIADGSTDTGKTVEKPTLDDFEMTRDEATELLTEEKVKFKKNASNAALAVMVAAILDEEDDSSK